MNWFVNSQVVSGEDLTHESLVIRQSIFRLCRIDCLAAMRDSVLEIQSLRTRVRTYLSFFTHQIARLGVQQKERDQASAIWFKDARNLRHVSPHVTWLHMREDRGQEHQIKVVGIKRKYIVCGLAGRLQVISRIVEIGDLKAEIWMLAGDIICTPI